MAHFCKNCGNSLRDGADFCPVCGERYIPPGARSSRRSSPAVTVLMIVFIVLFAAEALVICFWMPGIFKPSGSGADAYMGSWRYEITGDDGAEAVNWELTQADSRVFVNVFDDSGSAQAPSQSYACDYSLSDGSLRLYNNDFDGGYLTLVLIDGSHMQATTHGAESVSFVLTRR